MPSRRSEPSQAARISREIERESDTGRQSARRVAITRSPRRTVLSFIHCPTCASGRPCQSDVIGKSGHTADAWMKLPPAARYASSSAYDVSRLVFQPKEWVPRQSSETCRPVLPRVRFFICVGACGCEGCGLGLACRVRARHVDVRRRNVRGRKLSPETWQGSGDG